MVRDDERQAARSRIWGDEAGQQVPVRRIIECPIEPGPKYPEGATVRLCATCGRLERECGCAAEEEHDYIPEWKAN